MEVKELQAEFDAARAEIKAALKVHAEASKETSAEAKEALATVKTALKNIEGYEQRFTELEQRAADGHKAGTVDIKTLGRMVIEAEGLKAFQEGRASATRLEFKETVMGSTPAGVLVPADRQAGIISGPFQKLKVRQALGSGNTSSNAVEYLRGVADVKAQEVAEAAEAEESSLVFSLEQANVQDIATVIPVTKNALADSVELMSYIDTQLRYAVDLRIDRQLIAGNGTAPNLSGMKQAGNINVFIPDADDSELDSISKAIAEVEDAGYEVEVIFLNPRNWAKYERMRDSTGQYVLANPLSGQIVPTLYGRRVVTTAAVAEGEFFVGAMSLAFMVFNRAGTVIEMSNSDGTTFRKGVVTLRASARLALASLRPGAARYGKLKAA
jgi:HK97 family phage major capsid protein